MPLYLVSIASSPLVALLALKALLVAIHHQGAAKRRFHPIVGTFFHELTRFRRLHHYFADQALKHRTFRILKPGPQEVYTVDPANVEYILKTNFHNYAKDGKICLSDDILPDDFNVRKGQIVAYVPYAMRRAKFLWGSDACAFHPERWLDKEGVFKQENHFKFTAFQAGPRICLGKEFAFRQMKIFDAMLLHFKFKLEHSKPVKYCTMITLNIDQGLHLNAYSR